MIKKAVTISLIVCVLGSLVRFAMPLTWYIANYDHITSDLCVNRNNPDIDCDGMCQLEKKMQERHEKQAQEAPSQRVDRQAQINLFFTQLSPSLFAPNKKIEAFTTLDDNGDSLWLSDPPCPPPKLG